MRGMLPGEMAIMAVGAKGSRFVTHPRGGWLIMRTSVIGSVLAAALGAAACAQVPAENVDAARAALDTVIVEEAQAFAPAELQAAQAAREALDAELAAQQGRFPLFRSYDRTAELAAQAEQAAAAAIQTATLERERVREEVAVAVAAARTSLTDAGLLLDSAPAGKGSTADIAVMRADLDAALLSLAEADSDLQAERFDDARAKADAAAALGAEVRAAVEQAEALVAGAR